MHNLMNYLIQDESGNSPICFNDHKRYTFNSEKNEEEFFSIVLNSKIDNGLSYDYENKSENNSFPLIFLLKNDKQMINNEEQVNFIYYIQGFIKSYLDVSKDKSIVNGIIFKVNSDENGVITQNKKDNSVLIVFPYSKYHYSNKLITKMISNIGAKFNNYMIKNLKKIPLCSVEKYTCFENISKLNIKNNELPIIQYQQMVKVSIVSSRIGMKLKQIYFGSKNPIILFLYLLHRLPPCPILVKIEKQDKNDYVVTAADRDIMFTKDMGPEELNIYRYNLFIPMVNTDRLKDEWFCNVIGGVIKNTFEKDEGYEIYSNYLLSKCKDINGDVKSEKYIKYISDYDYISSNNHYTWKTIAWFAREDRPDLFKVWHENVLDYLLDQACPKGDSKEVSHVKIGNLLFWFNMFDFACYGVHDNKSWFKFNGTHWKQTEGGTLLRSEIYLGLKKWIIKKIELIVQKVKEFEEKEEDEQNAQEVEENAKIFEDLKKKAFKMALVANVDKTNSFSTEIMKSSSDLFYVPNLLKIFDTNPLTIAFKRSVLQADSTGITYRPGFPEDYIVLVNNIETTENLTDSDECVLFAESWLKQMFRDPHKRKTFKRSVASFLRGRNEDKKLFIFTGSTDSGKTTLIEVLKEAFGDYSGTMNFSNISEDTKSSGSTAPELHKNRNKRIVSTGEPNLKDKFQNGTVKTLTGNDMQTIRNLYQQSEHVYFLFKLIVFCNNIPSWSYIEPAIIERTIIFKVTARFVTYKEYCLYTKKEIEENDIHLKDTNFRVNVRKIARGLLYIAVKEYPHYMKKEDVGGSLCVPDIMFKDRDDYFNDIDDFQKFKSNCVVCQKDVPVNQRSYFDKAEVSRDDLYNEFVIWCQDNKPRRMIPDSSVFVKELSNRLNMKFENNKFKNCMIKQDYDSWIEVKRIDNKKTDDKV